jgi:hypothetical protein
LLARCGPAWWLMDNGAAWAWFEGAAPDPILNITGRFPLREILDRLAPLDN